MLFVHREKGSFLSVYVDDIKVAGEKQNIVPMWKVLNKEVDLGAPTSFLDHVYFGCTQRQCEISKKNVDNHRTMFESPLSSGNRKTTTPSKSSYFFMVLCYGRSCKEMSGAILWVCKQDESTTPQSMNSMHWWPSFVEEEMKSLGEVSKISPHTVLKCLYLARIGRLDIWCSVNKLARSITKWTKACDKRLCRLISCIHLVDLSTQDQRNNWFRAFLKLIKKFFLHCEVCVINFQYVIQNASFATIQMVNCHVGFLDCYSNHLMPPQTNSNEFGGGFGMNWQIQIRFWSSRKWLLPTIRIFCVFNIHRHCTCECAAACLDQLNSNIVASLMILGTKLFYTYIYIYIYIYIFDIYVFERCSKKHETILEGPRLL